MIKKLYGLIRNKLLSAPAEAGEPSAGLLQARVRDVALEALDNGGSRVLEIGCGEGFFLNKVLARRPDAVCTGVDISEEQLERAGKRLGAGVTLSRIDGSRLPFADGSFDVVVAVNVLMNLADDETVDAVIGEAARVCAPGGCLVFDIRNAANILMRIKYRLAGFYDATIDCSQLRLFKADDIAARFNNVGIESEQTRPVRVFPLGVAAYVMRARKRLKSE
jgi:ubiquinone/menaquinone biosynthesis C-methylase UbiE